MIAVAFSPSVCPVAARIDANKARLTVVQDMLYIMSFFFFFFPTEQRQIHWEPLLMGSFFISLESRSSLDLYASLPVPSAGGCRGSRVVRDLNAVAQVPGS